MSVADRELLILSNVISKPVSLAALFAKDENTTDSPRYEPARTKGLSPGALLYLELHYLASGPSWKINNTRIEAICSSPDFVDYLRLLHDIPDTISFSELQLHESGTTSFIFSVNVAGFPRCALKTIHAQYFKLDDVREATRNYKEHFNRFTDYSPTIFASSDNWILMQFIDGVRLSEYLQDLRDKHTFLSPDYFIQISTLITALLTALSYYESQSPPVVHGDLTPFNILVQDKDNSGPRVILLDFGPNYVLRDRVVVRNKFADTFAQTELFIAPEVLKDNQQPTILADIYSLGKIILEALSPAPLRQETVGIRLRAIWEDSTTVGLAKIVEDLIDDDPSKRLVMLNDVKVGSVFAEISSTLRETIRIYNGLTAQAQDITDLKQLSRFRWKPDVWASIRTLYQISYSTEKHYTEAGKELFFASTLNAFFQTTIVFSFIAYTLADMKYAWFPEWNIPLANELIATVAALPRAFQLGDIWTNLPGRLVGLTFGLVAARYYSNLFASIKVTAKNDFYRDITNLFLRSNCLSYFLPVMIAIVWYPPWWPWCSFFGSLFPAIANWFSWHSAKFGARRAEKTFSLSGYYDNEFFLGYFRESWVLMGSYSVGIGMIGVALHQGWAVDEKIYAYAVCITNMAKIYRNNCSSEAPYVSGNLARLFYASHRSEQAEQLSTMKTANS